MIAMRLTSLVLVTICVCLNFMEFSDAAGIVINPGHFSEIIPEDVHISCRTNGIKGSELIMMQVGKKGEITTLAEIQSDSPAENNADDSSVKVEGHVDESFGESYLNVTLLKPSKERAGVYECRIYYKSEEGQISDHVTEAELSVTKTDAILGQLLETKTAAMKRMDALEARITAIENKICVQPTPKPTEKSDDCIKGLWGICIPG